MPISTTKTGFTEAEVQGFTEAEILAFTALHLLTARRERTPERSVDLITEETPEGSLLAASRALEAAPMVVAASTGAVEATEAAGAIGSRMLKYLEFVKIQEWRK